ncbi:MAG: alpha/beta fold hydrolase [Isosphaeraceae bacterium]
MPFIPTTILSMWLRGLLSIAIIAGGLFLLREWYEHSHAWESTQVQLQAGTVSRAHLDDGLDAKELVVPRRGVFRWNPGLNQETAELVASLLLLALAFGGRLGTKGISLLLLKQGTDDPQSARDGTVQRLRRPDGSELQVELYGPPDAPPIILTHGWGANSTEWYYIKKHLSGRFQLIVWDLPGLGLSRKPENNDYSLEKLAQDLAAVLALAGDRPAVLVGHSIGGMITLTFCGLFPKALGHRVAGLVLAHTTYTNPVRTTKNAALYTALEKPVLIPLLHLTIALWPLVWLMNWLSYLNGSAHRSMHRESFAGTETRGQLGFTTRFMPHARPDVLSRGMFGMLQYDATTTLGSIRAPVLIVDGDRDTTTTPEASEKINRDVPRSKRFSLSPARHLGLIEHNERFNELVGNFAESCQPSGAIGGTSG